MNQEFKSMP